MGASAFELRSSPGECVEDAQVTGTVASHSLQSAAVVMAEPVATSWLFFPLPLLLFPLPFASVVLLLAWVAFFLLWLGVAVS